MVKIYNKAIRDKIPNIIKEKGQQCEYIILDDESFLKQLERKLEEELEEYKESEALEELVDIVEIIYRIFELKGKSKETIENMREKKNIERGAFAKNYFLIKIKEI